MKTLEERTKEIQAEADRNIERVKREYEMKAKLDVPLEYDTPQTCGCNLYGSKISAIFRQRSHGRDNYKNPDANLLRHLIKKHKPVPLRVVKGGCTSIVPKNYEHKGRIYNEFDIFPITIRIESLHAFSSVNWCAMVEDELVRMQVDMPIPKSMSVVPMVEANPGCPLWAKETVYGWDLKVAISELMMEKIRWSNGCHPRTEAFARTPNDFTVCWHEQPEWMLVPEDIASLWE